MTTRAGTNVSQLTSGTLVGQGVMENPWMAAFFLLLLLRCILGIPVALNGQSEGIRFQHWNVEDGLSSNSVLCVGQDTSGFMWFGTQEGLNRFDGYSFKVFHHLSSDSLSISSNHINTIFFDKRSRMWVGTDNGLNLFDPTTQTFRIFFPSDNESERSIFYVKSIAEDAAGNLLVGTSSGLFKFAPDKQSFVPYQQSPRLIYQNGTDNITDIVPDAKGFFWLCTTQTLKILKDGQLLAIDQLTQEHSEFSELFHIRTLMEQTDGTYWLGSEVSQKGFLFRVNPQFKLLSSPEIPVPQDKIRVIKELSSGNVAIGALDGFYLYTSPEGKINHYYRNKQDPHSLSHNSVRDIYEDRDGGIWLATYRGGINYYHPDNQLFQLIQEEPWKANSLSHDVVTALVEDEHGDLWIGTEHGLNYYDTQENKFTHYFREDDENGLLNNVIKSLTLDQKGNLLIGTLSGLSVLDTRRQQFISFTHAPDDSTTISFGHIHDVFLDTDGQVWIGTNGGGLNLYEPDRQQFQRFTAGDGQAGSLIGDQVNTMIQQDSLLWIGTQRGLDVLHRRDHHFLPRSTIADHPLLQTNILSLYLGSDDILWIGTENFGLLHYNLHTAQIFVIDQSNGLLTNSIKAILEDDAGNLWVSTNRGLSKIIRPSKVWTEQLQYETVNFRTGNGLQGLEYYANSALEVKSGEFYFGGNNGLNSFFPDDIPDKIQNPRVVFTSMQIGENKPYPFNQAETALTNITHTKPISLTHRQSDFSISFSALYYTAPQEIVYAYRLDPIDEDWNVLDKQHSVNFKQLPAGSYTFRVRASNDPKHWKESSSTLRFEILPPWWKSPLAIIGYVLLAMILLVTFFLLATRWERLKTELRIGQLEREQAHELHQQRLRFFTDLSHELRTPLTLILAPLGQLIKQSEANLRIQNQLTMIQRNGERMLNLINQILDIRKTETGNTKLKAAEGNIVKFLQEVTLSFREIALIQKVDFYFNAGEEVIRVFFDRDKLEVVMYNLLSNAFKFTPPGGQVSVIVRLVHARKADVPDEVEVMVQDNGRGIPQEVQQQIFERFFQNETSQSIDTGTGIGLDLAKKFIDLHYGHIDVISVPTKDEVPGYTRFSFRLPCGSDHLDENEIISKFISSEDISLYAKNWFLLNPSREEVNIDAPGLAPPPTAQSMLIVEDNLEVRQYLCQLFRTEFKIYEAGNGQDGVDLAFETVPDIIISDVMMPEIDGMEMCRKLKSDIRTSHIPIILLTARTAISFRFEGIETGADDYISKPFDSEHLQLRVRNLIQQRQWIRRHFNNRHKLLPERIALTSVDERLLRETIDYIRENISEPELTVERLSREVGLSRVHFYRKLKALANLSPVEFIRNVRLECAAELLATNRFNVSEVRYRVGMQDADYFRKCFKQKYGVTPSEYSAKK